KMIKNALGPDFIVVTPGVRPVWAEKGDQKRILSPSEAVRQGADYIVVGRPIIESDDPAGAAARIVREIEEA
ncbi:MAG: orotidine 5'-phosphate decarboxylase, partial [Candidatus Omnitrophica bacterium]|nr:orotidine 5'-phosphate decarboxylase [Candidatus Omnitrophota bacterium]